MRNDPTRAQYVGIAQPAKLGALLRVGPEPLSFYWSQPSIGLHVAAIGRQAVGDVKWIDGAAPAWCFGGWTFDGREDWFVPEVVAWWDGRESWLAAIASDAQSARNRLNEVKETPPSPSGRGVGVRERDLRQDAWNKLITAGLAEIDRGTFEKVVCARTIEVQFPGVIDERTVLKSLEARHPKCWTFMFRQPNGVFLGSSPELLLDASDGVWRVDALAGTAAAGKGEALLSDDKERREHQAVVSWISSVVDSYSIEFSAPSTPGIKQLANVDHLHTELSGRLKSDCDPLDLARALHPTPAVAGNPQKEAVAWLRANEGFDRGWYTGAIGARGPGKVTLAVGLRSALLRGSKATVYVGAGVVKGSTPEREWIETERKATALLDALGVSS
ncbi:MAG: isochorismate synthase [Archangium sp.]|nr:isochorismate synthase [Archangium sp.]